MTCKGHVLASLQKPCVPDGTPLIRRACQRDRAGSARPYVCSRTADTRIVPLDAARTKPCVPSGTPYHVAPLGATIVISWVNCLSLQLRQIRAVRCAKNTRSRHFKQNSASSGLLCVAKPQVTALRILAYSPKRKVSAYFAYFLLANSSPTQAIRGRMPASNFEHAFCLYAKRRRLEADLKATLAFAMAEMRANRTHPRRFSRLTTALKAAGATRPQPSPFCVRIS